MELYSFLQDRINLANEEYQARFPSPYGVIFILTLWSKKSSIAIYF